MKALVTGASGFVGGHLVAHLREAGDDVVSSDRTGADGIDITDRRQVFDAIEPDLTIQGLSRLAEMVVRA